MMKLYQEIEQRIKENKRVVIAIDGPCASGKSSFSEMLANKYNGIVFRMDDFFLPPELKTVQRLREIGGNVHYERIMREILTNLDEEYVTYRKYDCMTNELGDEQTVELPKVIMIEGAYSLRPDLRGYYDIKILLTVSEQIKLDRILKRNGTKMLERFINEWIPLENKYFEHEKLEKVADYIIDTLKENL